jgi:hypothetical protein
MTCVQYPHRKYSGLSLFLTHRDWCAVPWYSGRIHFADQISKEEGPNDVLFQQVETPPHFHVAGRDYVYRNFPRKWIGSCGAITWPPHSLDLSPFYFSVWGYMNDTFYFPPLPPLCRNLLRVFQPLLLQLHPPCLQMCRLNLNRYIMICTGLPAVSPLNVFKLLGVGHKIFINNLPK